LHSRWSTAKVDTTGLGALLKTRQQMNDLGYTPEVAPLVLYFLTARLGDKDISDLRRAIPRKDLVAAWQALEDNAHALARRLMGKDAATPSRAWQLLSSSRPEMVLFLAITARQQAVAQKIKNFFTKWRQVRQKVPLPEMTELRITPQMPGYAKIANDVFLLLLDGKLHSRTETLKFLKPLAPPPPPPPPSAKRGRGAKAVVAAAAVAGSKPGAKAKVKGKVAAVLASAVAPVKEPVAAPVKGTEKGKPVPAAKPVAAGKPVAPAKPAKPVAAKASKTAKAPARKQPSKPAKAKKSTAKKKVKARAKPKPKPKPKKKAKPKPKQKPKPKKKPKKK
jgi:hypothetical protein